MNQTECDYEIPINSIPVEIKITCRTPEVLLLVEEALLSRLQDFCIEVPNNNSELTSRIQSMRINNHSGKLFIN